MDYKVQTTALVVIFVLVGLMVVIVPAISEKALAIIISESHATATGICGPEGKTFTCNFVLQRKHLTIGTWVSEPTKSGTVVTWGTKGIGAWGPTVEEGYVLYNVGEHYKEQQVGELVYLHFRNGSDKGQKNECQVIPSVNPPAPSLSGTCNAGSGRTAEFTYTLRSIK